jgi:divinyl chlorophyllide a 8-vinyl-reductase
MVASKDMANLPSAPADNSLRIFMLGATGTIGQATVRALIKRSYDVVCFVRPGSELATDQVANPLKGAELRHGQVTNARSIAQDGFRGEKFDVLLSCLASRNGSAEDASAIDYSAHVDALAAARFAGVKHVVLLSAICVQKPLLAFQHAKLAFEKILIESGMTYSIVRPTAFFKSLSGQVERVKKGKSFLVFGDGEMTACKPVSDRDLAEYLVDCVENEKMHNRILPIGGPGAAITPKQQGEMLFALLQQKPRFRHVPLRLLDFIIGGLNMVGRIIPAATRKAELARIGRYYATESMLVMSPETGEYDADATPSTGTELLSDHYLRLISENIPSDLGEHSVF